MEDDGCFYFSMEEKTALFYKKYLSDIITTTRALLENVREHRIAILADREKCKKDFEELVERLEDEVRSWQNFAVTWKISQDHAQYTEAMEHFKHLYVELRDDRRTTRENHEKLIANCLDTAQPLLRLYNSHRRLLLAEQKHVRFDASVPDTYLDYLELENLANTHMWHRPI